VREKDILLQDRSRSTIEDAKFSFPLVSEHRFKSLILVTSPTHTRRAGRVFRKVFSSQGIKIMVWPVRKSKFNPSRWWTRYEDATLVAWEYMATILYTLKGY
ncbi:YdcF family protein, partial [Candidatus Saganbacteria bacterium]|nr:YdcF family protein [Candidatus Saganbacteria bacterium]